MLLRIALAVAVFATGASACQNPGVADCTVWPIPHELAPAPAGFERVAATDLEPFACGDNWRMHLVFAQSSATTADALEAFTTALEAQRWTPTDCVTRRERCFESDTGYFLAATTPSARRAGYPKPLGDGPQVLAVMSRALPDPATS